MSCIVHEDKTFNRVLWSIEAYKSWTDMIGYCFKHIYDPEGFVKRLHEWNHKAYSERYADRDEMPPYKPRCESPKLSPIELVKLLQSINYQCSDAREFEQSEDGRHLREAINRLMSYIVSYLPEYQTAAWW